MLEAPSVCVCWHDMGLSLAPSGEQFWFWNWFISVLNSLIMCVVTMVISTGVTDGKTGFRATFFCYTAFRNLQCEFSRSQKVKRYYFNELSVLILFLFFYPKNV